MNIDALYKDLLNAQLDKNWGKVAKIQIELYRHPEYRRESAEEGDAVSRPQGEGSVESDPEDVRDHEGTV